MLAASDASVRTAASRTLWAKGPRIDIERFSSEDSSTIVDLREIRRARTTIYTRY